MTLRFEFAYDGGKPGAGGNGSIFVNGEKVAAGRIANTQRTHSERGNDGRGMINPFWVFPSSFVDGHLGAAFEQVRTARQGGVEALPRAVVEREHVVLDGLLQEDSL